MLIYEIDYGNIKNQVECDEHLWLAELSSLSYLYPQQESTIKSLWSNRSKRKLGKSAN